MQQGPADPALCGLKEQPASSEHKLVVPDVAMKQILMVALRWAGGWALIGLIVGVLLMLDRTPPFAESGGRSGSILSYAVWVPATGGLAAALGFLLGLVFAILMGVTEGWRSSLAPGPGIVERFGPSVLCGAAAGAIVGLFTGQLGVALVLTVLGAGSAVVSVLRSGPRTA
jgi:hypothetical protein